MMDIDGNIQEGGVDFVALVERPAIQKGFLAFNDHTQKAMAFSITSEDRHIVSGPLMLADTPIYRIDEEGEYYVSFPANVIERIAVKFYQQGKQANVNEMHDATKKVEGVTMFESFLVDSSRGIAPMQGYKDAPEGSWFGSFKVENEAIWQSIKAGEYMGFSVEGMFSRYLPNKAPKDHGFTADELKEIDAVSKALDILTNKIVQPV